MFPPLLPRFFCFHIATNYSSITVQDAFHDWRRLAAAEREAIRLQPPVRATLLLHNTGGFVHHDIAMARRLPSAQTRRGQRSNVPACQSRMCTLKM